MLALWKSETSLKEVPPYPEHEKWKFTFNNVRPVVSKNFNQPARVMRTHIDVRVDERPVRALFDTRSDVTIADSACLCTKDTMAHSAGQNLFGQDSKWRRDDYRRNLCN